MLARRDPGQDLAGDLVGQGTGRLGDQAVAKHRPVAVGGSNGLRLVFNHLWSLRGGRSEDLSAGVAATMSLEAAATKTDRGVQSERDGPRPVA